MSGKLKGLAFLCKCFLHVAKQICAGRKWNMFIADLEGPKGRIRYTYRITGGNTVFHSEAL